MGRKCPWAAIGAIIACAFCCLASCSTLPSTEAREATTGPYTFVYRLVTGDYARNAPVYAELSASLRERGIDAVRSIGIFLDDSTAVPAAKLRSVCGVIIEEKDWGKIEKLGRAFKIQHISRAMRVVAECRLDGPPGSPQGSARGYPAVSRYAAQKGYAPLSYFEIYGADKTLCVMSTIRPNDADAESGSPSDGVPRGPLAGAQVPGSDWPDPDWQVSTPEAQGMSSRVLVQSMDRLCAYFDLDVLDGFLITRHGRIVAEVSVAPNQPEMRHEVHSVTKSVLGALVGIAIKKGFIKSADDRVVGYFPGETFANMDDRKRSMTIGDLLNMTSGLRFEDSPDEAMMARSPDWARFTLGLPMVARPGTRFNYSSGDPNILSAILTKTTGMNALAFARRELFGPLGITDVQWLEGPHGNTRGESGLFLTPRDMAKIGYLFLRDGVWKGERLLPAGWASGVCAGPTRTGLDAPFYCRLWWVDPGRSSYSACGSGGQFIIVLPQADIVAVVTAKEPLTFDRFFEHTNPFEYANDLILPAVESDGPLPQDVEALNALARRMRSFSVETKTPSPRLSQTAASVSGRLWLLTPNAMGLQSATLTMGPDAAVLDLRAGQATFSLPVGLDGVYRKSKRIDYGLGVGGMYASKGRWENDRTFVADFRVLEGDHGGEIKLRFDGNQVFVTFVFSDPFVFSMTIPGKDALSQPEEASP